MAERRMFTKKVTDDDNFINLSSSSQALYLHLSMSADDDGFCNQVSVAMFKAHASVQDLQALLELRYIYQFDNGVIVIKHWRMANALRKDRYTPTAFQEEMKKLCIKDNGAYTWLPDGCQMVTERLPQDRIEEVRVEKNKKFIPPTLEEVQEYCRTRGNKVNAEQFIDYYSARGWKLKSGTMRDWRAAIRTWERNGYDDNPAAKKDTKFNTFEQRDYNYSDLERKLLGG